MSVNGFPRSPIQPGPVPLLTHDAWGRPAPEGYGFDPQTGACIPLAYPAHADVNPNVPWDYHNPLWRALYQGNVTIENQPGQLQTPAPYGQQLGFVRPQFKTHEDVAMVPKDAYFDQGDRNEPEPTQDMGTFAVIGAGEVAGVGRVNYRLAQSLVGYMQVPSPDDTSSLAVLSPTQPQLLNVPPTQADTAHPPIGGCVAITQLEFGHLGFQHNVWFDTPQAQVIRVPFGGSFGRFKSMLAPKYFTNDDNTLVANTRVYLLFPGGPQLTSQLWNDMDQNVLIRNGFPRPPDNANKVPFKGYFAKAFIPNITQTQPMRRFYGSVKCTGAVKQNTRCPIAWDAAFVTLVGGDNTVGGQTLQFIIRGLTSGGGVTQTWGPFNIGETVRLPVGATSIEVINAPTAVGGLGAIELPFELDYTLSF